MTQILNPTHPTNFSPTDSLNPTSQWVEEFSEQALTKGVNLAQLIAKTYLTVEAHSQDKSHLKIDELEAHQKKLSAVTRFLSEIETQLSNSSTKQVNIDRELVEEVYTLLDNTDSKGKSYWQSLFKDKPSWSREEADVIRKGLTRHSQIIIQQVHQLSSAVNRSIEEGTELLQIARKCLEMLDRLHQTFTSNQRGR